MYAAKTGYEVIANERKHRIEHGMNVPRYAVSPDATSIAAWAEKESRWVCIAGQLISSNEWCPMNMELCVNGVPLSQQIEWTEVPA